MEIYDSIIFDLDGTLWDASNSSAAGWNTALEEAGFPEIHVTADRIRGIAGLPFKECLTTLFGHIEQIDCESLGSIIDAEERRYVELSGGDLFEGVKTGIESLSDSYPLYLVSNCQSWYLESFWAYSALEPFFKGQDSHGDSGVSKAEMIATITAHYSLNRPIYIGDTVWDQEASHEAGVAFGHVSYGFGKAVEPKHSFTNFDQLVDWFQDAISA
jgi:phosphoglycolate phosphatase